MSVLNPLLEPLKRRLKLRMAGDDVDALVATRARTRLRWLFRHAPDAVVSFRALRNLSELLDPEATDDYLAIVQAEPGSLSTPRVRTAAEALGRLMNGDAGPPLRRLLSANRPVGVQLAAARALATIGREQDWQALKEWAARSSQTLVPDERDCVQPAKRQPPGTTEITWVLETLYADKDARWWSSKASKWLASDQARPRMKQDAGADKIVAASHRNALERKEPDAAEFRRIVLHLGSLARERDQELLMGLVEQQDEFEHRRAAIQAVGLHGDLRSVPVAKSWLGEVPDGHGELAADLARVAGRLAFRELVPALVELHARFEHPAARANVLWALGECGGEDAVRFLIDRVRDAEADLSEDQFSWTARALVRCGVIGREAIRGSVAIARAGRGERDRVKRVAELAGIH